MEDGLNIFVLVYNGFEFLTIFDLTYNISFSIRIFLRKLPNVVKKFTDFGALKFNGRTIALPVEVTIEEYVCLINQQYSWTFINFVIFLIRGSKQQVR
jgi:hypothetical protein